MREGEIIKFVVIASVILLIFIFGIITVIIQYLRKKFQHEQEKAALSEQHLRELFFTKLEIQQQTMQDIGREIHDSVNQKLTLASLYSYQLEAEHEQTRTGERISGIGNIINESIAELRSMSKKLTEYDDEGSNICDLVDKECQRINTLTTCKASCSVNTCSMPLSPAVKNYVHRIIQEFIQNSIKHAACSNIIVDLNYNTAGLSVLLSDNGKGFDMGQYETNKTGIGLANMKKRSQLLGVDFSLNSAPGAGTEVRLFIPANKLKNTRNGI